MDKEEAIFQKKVEVNKLFKTVITLMKEVGCESCIIDLVKMQQKVHNHIEKQ